MCRKLKSISGEGLQVGAHNLVDTLVRLKIKKNEFKSRAVRLNLEALSMLIVKETYNVQANSRFEALKLLDEDRLPPKTNFSSNSKKQS